MIDNSIFPHFIPDIPKGVDAFEGRSQERLAHNICEYIRKVDAKADTDDGIRIPRIIGLEGGWGTGKSNVVRMIRNTMDGESYYTFTYDAWGHQEDLQRRSILESLTNVLITDKVLRGTVEIQMRNGKPHEAEWGKQLSLLLSNKTTTTRRSIPVLSTAALWGALVVVIFTLCSLLAGQLIENECDLCKYWLLDAIPVLFAVVIAIVYRTKDGNWNGLKRMVDKNSTETVDEEYTSSEEPSVAEFKNWMKAISNHLGKEKGNDRKKKLIIVFDNMDRLPSEKVMQLWSSIYTFFAGIEFENIWAIIPYDYRHLCQAIYGMDDKECNVETKEDGSKDSGDTSDSDPKSETIKRFIEKTFPITYIVPQPVITDYKRLFNSYFEAAFGKGQHDQEHISQVFMQLHSNPNPRTIISFVNELVAMRMQWDDEKYRLQNLALYILKRDYLFHNESSLEANLLKDNLFDQVSPLYPEREEIRTQICQFAYGLDNEDLAKELPLRNELARNIKEGTSLKDYVERPNFLTVLENVLNDVNIIGVSNAIKSLESIDDVEKDENFKAHIQKKWDMLTNLKAEMQYGSHSFDKDIPILINHASNLRIEELCDAYCKSMQEIAIENGAEYYNALNDLQMALDDANKEIHITDYLKQKVCEPEHFVEFVCEAKEKYKTFKLITDNSKLNEHLLTEAIAGKDSSAVTVHFIKDDHDLEDLRERLSIAIADGSIKEDICAAAYINRVLYKGDDVMVVPFSHDIIVKELLRANKNRIGYADVLAMSMAESKNDQDIDETVLPNLCECIERYMTYTDILKNLGTEGKAFRKLNIYMIENQKGNNWDAIYVAKNLSKIADTLKVDAETLFGQFNRCKEIDWGELSVTCDYVVNVQLYVQEKKFENYKAYPGNFSNSIISLGVKAMDLKKTGFLAQKQQNSLSINQYWKKFVMTFLGTDYMSTANEMLTNEAVTMLSHLYNTGNVVDADLLSKILYKADRRTLIGYLHGLMNNHLIKEPINIPKFKWFGKLIPMLGDSMDQNTARGLITNFIKPVIKDAECLSIINENKKFYLGVLNLDKETAAPIIKDMNKSEGCDFIADILKEQTQEAKDSK